MKVILRADIDSLGRLGEEVKVKPGYGRNYLLPKGLAMLATEANRKVFESEKNKLQAAMDAIKAKAQELADKINGVELTIPVRVGEADKLYGSVTSSNLADALLEKGLDVEKKKIMMDEPIRALGDYSYQVRLHPDVRAEFNVHVVRHEQEESGEEE